eukprot:m.176831 g.176831  ORF g.176831 m.176831 type:complete len:118 (+) comp39148_c0_seq19:837-1190(+)
MALGQGQASSSPSSLRYAIDPWPRTQAASNNASFKKEGMAGIVPIDNFRREAALLFKSIRLEDIDWIGSLQSGTFGGYSFVQTSSLILSLRFQIRTLVWNSSDSYMQSHSATVLCRE